MSAMPGPNPYRPGVGTPPIHFAGRDKELRRFRSTLRGAPGIPANMRLTGLRGVGKTVLLGKYADTARDENWVSIRLELEPRHNTEQDLLDWLQRACDEAQRRASTAAKARAAVKGAARTLKGAELSWGEASLRLPDLDAAQTRQLVDVLEAATATVVRSGYNGLILLLDEAQALVDERSRTGEHPLSMLLAAFAALQREEVPIGLVLCGLPTLTTNLLAARTYTERMFRAETIGTLDPDAAREAFLEPLDGTSVDCDRDVVEAVMSQVEGYPYFIQLWGAELWDAADSADVQHISHSLLEVVEPEIFRRLDLEFYEPRVSALTEAEQDVLLASRGCPYPPLKVADLNMSIDKSPANVNVLLGRLVAAGVLYRARKGQYHYTAPKFYEFLQRRSN